MSAENFTWHTKHLTLKTPRKPASENVVCLCHLLNILANFSNLFYAYRQTVWTLIRAVWPWSTLFAKMTFKITSRWQSRRQLLWLAVYGLKYPDTYPVLKFHFLYDWQQLKCLFFSFWWQQACSYYFSVFMTSHRQVSVSKIIKRKSFNC